MSRVGKHSIQVPSGVNLTIHQDRIEATGPVGKDAIHINDKVIIKHENGIITVNPVDETDAARSMWGTIQRSISNLVNGVSKGFTVNLDLVGVGYRAAVQGRNVFLQLGYSHEVVHPLPEGINAKCEKPTSIAISGPSKQVVGQVAAEIRSYRKPEPYKGKGIIRQGEFVVRKEGKKK